MQTKVQTTPYAPSPHQRVCAFAATPTRPHPYLQPPPIHTHIHASHRPLTRMHLHVQRDEVACSRRIRGARRPTPCQSKVEGDCGQSSECSVQPQWLTSAWAKKMKRGKGNSWERRGGQRDGGRVAYTRTGAGWAVWADCQCTVILDQLQGLQADTLTPAGCPPKPHRWTTNHCDDQLHALSIASRLHWQATNSSQPKVQR